MTDDEKALWHELRRRDHQRRAESLQRTKTNITDLQSRVRQGEPKASKAVKTVDAAKNAVDRCRWPLEDSAAEEFGDGFAIKTFTPPAHDEPQTTAEWYDAAERPWWPPALAAGIIGFDRAKLCMAAGAGKIRVRATKHGLEYLATDVTRWMP